MQGRERNLEKQSSGWEHRITLSMSVGTGNWRNSLTVGRGAPQSLAPEQVKHRSGRERGGIETDQPTDRPPMRRVPKHRNGKFGPRKEKSREGDVGLER